MQTDWHCHARVFRQAIPGFRPFCSIEDILALAQGEEAEARLIEQSVSNPSLPEWKLTHGPLDALPARSERNWTVLVQGLNLLLEPAARLLDQFRFIPDARLDDLMVSYATDGGGVGPHFDSYDVFLLQMHGQRRWRISAQTDLSLQPDMPLKILRNFQPEAEFILNPGDMLYLPPRYAHDGVAIGECTTLSIGFRSPTAAELLSSVLHQLAEDVLTEPGLNTERFVDPRRGVAATPAQLPTDLLQWVQQHLGAFQPTLASIEKGLLIERTEPKDTVMFEAPRRAPGRKQVLRMLATQGVELHRASRLMYGANGFACNGEWFAWFEQAHDCNCIRQLADERRLTPSASDALNAESAFAHWCTAMLDAGWIQPLSTSTAVTR